MTHRPPEASRPDRQMSSSAGVWEGCKTIGHGRMLGRGRGDRTSCRLSADEVLGLAVEQLHALGGFGLDRNRGNSAELGTVGFERPFFTGLERPLGELA